ncbi:MAG: NAD(P)-dependent oxidoreductase, partial [Planctomycetota bacterium]
TRSFFENNDDVRLISRHGVGCDNVDLEAASEHGVIVTRVAKADERDAVAELSVALIMACAREVKSACDAALSGRWSERAGFVGLELSAATVGIIGFGSIGSRVGEIMDQGFNSRVLAYDPYVSDEDIRSHGAEPASLEEMLPQCDVLSFNAEHTGDNYQMVGERELEMLKDGAIVVNTARGELTDEEALARAAREGKISAVGLDVCEQEPPPEDHPLLELSNLILLPHVGSYTHATLERMDRKMAEDVEALLDGRFPEEVVNPQVLQSENRAEDTV